MNIETCVNINVHRLEELADAAERLMMPVNRLMAVLFHRFMADKSLRPVMFSRVRYQKRDVKKNWRKFHLRLRCDEYEKCMDLRKVGKLSVSFILALAMDKYLASLMDEDKEKCEKVDWDNYPACYFFISHFDKYDDFFSIYWTPIGENTPHPTPQ